MTSLPWLDAGWLVQVLGERKGFKAQVSAGILIPGISIVCTCHAESQWLNYLMKSAESADKS